MRAEHDEAVTEELLDAVLGAYLRDHDQEQAPDRSELLARYPQLSGAFREFFADFDRVESMTAPLRGLAHDARVSTGTDRAALAGADPGPMPGQSFGDYDLVEVLGRGGMGVVYRARQRSLNRIVALKMVRADRLACAAEIQRFRNEAEAAAHLDHPNIVPIYEVGEHDGQHYFSMKYAEGGNLSGQVARVTAEPRSAASVLVPLARAVHHAHQRGVLHRDLKPGNVLLSFSRDAEFSEPSARAPALHSEDSASRLNDYVPMIGDFGLAKRLEQQSTLTQTGLVLGTPSYLAPEQASGASDSVTTATDVYGLGAILYELLTARPPFRGGNVLDTLEQVRSNPPEPPSRLNRRVPRDLETICLKCLEKDALRRYASAAALADDLERFLDGRPITAQAARWPERAVKWVRRRPVQAIFAAVSVLAVVAFAGGLVWHTVELGQALEQVRDREHKVRLREREVRQRLYVADMRLAHQFLWDTGAIGQMRQRLRHHTPGPGEEDHRDFAWFYLDRLARDSDACTLGRHEGRARAVAFAPDGRRLATAGDDGIVRLWDLATRKQRAELRGHEGPVCCVVFAPDGSFLATAGADGAIRFWDGGSGKPLGSLPRHPGGTLCLALSPDGFWLASGGHDRKARLWDVRSRREMANVARTMAVIAIALSADGKTVFLREDASSLIEIWSPMLGPGRGSGGIRAWWIGWDVLCLAVAPRTGEVLAGKANGGIMRGSVPGKVWDDYRIHLAAVRALVVSADGRHVVSGGGEGVVRTVDLVTGRARVVARGHEAGIGAIALSPDGRLVASASDDGSVKLWNWSDSQEYEALRSSCGPTTAASFTADGRMAALARRDGTVRLLDTKTWQERGNLAGAALEILSVALTPNGQMAATAGSDGTLRIWDTATGRERAKVACPAQVKCLAFSAGGEYLAVGCADSTLLLHDPATLKQRKVVKLPGLPTAVRFDPAGRRLGVTAGSVLVLYDAATGREQARKSYGATLLDLAFTRDERTVVASGLDGRLAFWDVTAASAPAFAQAAVGNDYGGALAISPDDRIVAVSVGIEMHLFDRSRRCLLRKLVGQGSSISVLAFTSDGQLLSVSGDGQLKRWDLNRHAVALSPGQPLGLVRALAYTPDGRTLLTSSADQPAEAALYPRFLIKNYRRDVKGNTGESVRLWDMASGRQRATLPLPAWVRLCSMALSPDGKTAAAGCSGGLVRLWDVPTARERHTLFTNSSDQARWFTAEAFGNWGLGHKAEFQTHVRAVAFSPDGRLLATASNDGRVRLWDTATAQETRTLCRDHANACCLAFSPDGATLAVNRGASVELWDVAGGRLSRELKGHSAKVQSLVFSPDGRLLASAGDDWRVRLWDMPAGGDRPPLVGHFSGVNCLAFSPDGRTLASGGEDHKVRLWHVATAQEELTLPCELSISAVAFSPNGRTLAGASEGEVLLWRTGDRP